MERIPHDLKPSAHAGGRPTRQTASVLLLTVFGLASLVFGYRACSAWTGSGTDVGGPGLFLLLVVAPFSAGTFCLHVAWRILNARLPQ